MKKLFILLCFVATATLAVAQNATVDKLMTYDQASCIYTGKVSDTIGELDSIWTFTVQKQSSNKLIPYIYVSADSTGGTAAAVRFILQQKVFPQETYTAIDTVTWKMTGDTSFVIEPTTAVFSEYFRLKVLGSTDNMKAKINYINFKFSN